MQTSLLTTKLPNELVFAYGVCTDTAVEGTGFTGRSHFHANFIADRIAATPGAYRAIGTMQAGTSWAMLGATFAPR